MWLLLIMTMAFASTFVEVVTTSGAGCARTDDGRVACWTMNLTPAFVDGVNDAKQVVMAGPVGNQYACALRTSGDVHCWGDRSPGDVERLRGARYLLTERSGDTLCGHLDDGVLCLLNGAYFNAEKRSKLEGPRRFTSEHPVQLLTTSSRWGGLAWCFVNREGSPKCSHLVDERSGFTAVAKSGEAACGVREGLVYCGGSGYEGNLGNGKSSLPEPVKSVRVDGPTDVVQLASSDPGNAFCARSRQGEVWCWGSNHAGSLGTGLASHAVLTPTLIPGLKATDLSMWPGGGCATTSEGGISCWGDFVAAQPRPVPGVAGVQELVASDHATCARASDGRVWCWGDLDIDDRRLHEPTLMPEAQGWSGIALKSDTPGWRLCGIEGGDQVACTFLPVNAERKTQRWRLDGVERLLAPRHASPLIFALKKGGEVWMWSPASGSDPRALDARVASGSIDAAANAGVVTLGPDGTVWLHGTDSGPAKPLGEVPRGSTLLQTGRRSPLVLARGVLLVERGGEFQPYENAPRAIGAAGEKSLCVLRGNGTVACDRQISQALGGSLIDGSFVDVPGVRDAVELVGGVEHYCVLHRNRTVSCFGSRGLGQLGDGIVVSLPKP